MLFLGAHIPPVMAELLLVDGSKVNSDRVLVNKLDKKRDFEENISSLCSSKQILVKILNFCW